MRKHLIGNPWTCLSRRLGEFIQLGHMFTPRIGVSMDARTRDRWSLPTTCVLVLKGPFNAAWTLVSRDFCSARCRNPSWSLATQKRQHKPLLERNGILFRHYETRIQKVGQHMVNLTASLTQIFPNSLFLRWCISFGWSTSACWGS